jgi:hypothetical protein
MISSSSTYVYIAIVIAVAAAMILYGITNALQLSLVGRFAYYARRPGNELLRNMRRSSFYYPLKRALGFDPAILMVLVATAIVCLVASWIIGYLITLLQGLGMSLEALGDGRVFNGLWRLIGVLLLAAIFYLMALVTIVFVHWLFGLLGRAAHVAMERIGPLLDLFEFGGVFAGWSFLILWIALSIAAAAVRFIFFR